MAARTWLKLVRNSFVAAAVLTAAQVGVGSGLAIVDWPLGFTAIRGWGQLLTWVAFIFAGGVVGGAVLAGRTLRRSRPALSGGNRVAAAFAAALGSGAALPLVWIPVRVHLPVIDMRAELTMAVTVGIAVLCGLVLAIAALTWRSVAACVGATVVWVWAFALVSVGLAAADRVRVSPRLGVIDAPGGQPWWASPFMMVGLAAFLGLVVGSVAGWKGGSWLGIALSGVSGPVLVASAYLITGWGVSGNGEDARPYLAAVFGVGAGLLASMAVASATIPHRPAARPAKPILVAAAEPPRAAIAALPAPLAITSYAEPAYVLESSPVEPSYRRQPPFHSQSIYLPTPRPAGADIPTPRPEPAFRPDLHRRPEPASESPYRPPYEAPYEPPYDPARPPRPASVGDHAAIVEAVVVESTVVRDDAVIVPPSPSDRADAAGRRRTTKRTRPEPTGPEPQAATNPAAASPVPASPVPASPVAASPVAASPVSASPVSANPVAASNPATTNPAAGNSAVTNPVAGHAAANPVGGHAAAANPAVARPVAAKQAGERGVPIEPSPAASATSAPAESDTASAASASATSARSASDPASSRPGGSEPAKPVPSARTAPVEAAPAAPAAGPGISGGLPATGPPRNAVPDDAKPETAKLETAAPETAAPETAAPGTTAPETTAPENGKRRGRQKDKQRRPGGRRGRGENEPKGRALRDTERDHIDWIDNLVKLPVDPTLETRER